MSKMTADEAVTAIAEASYAGENVTIEQCEASRNASAEIREAFAIADRARAELARLEADVAEASMDTKGQILWRQVQGEKRNLLKRITPHATAESRAREARRRGIAIRVRPAQGWAALCGHATARDRGPEYDRHVRDCERRGGVAFAHTLDRQQVHGD